MPLSAFIKEITVMLSIPKGSKLVPLDFLPALEVVRGCIALVAFGTVGVGHIWHLT